MGRIGLSLENLVRSTALVTGMALPVLFGGYEEPESPIEPPKDTTPPIVTIYSPLENNVYNSDTISFEWDIIEKNFKSAYYTLNNYQTKTPIEQSGKKDLILANKEDWLIKVYTDDDYGNWSERNVNFSVDKITPIFVDVFTPSDVDGPVYFSYTTKEDRDRHLDERVKENWVSTMPYHSDEPLWVCGHYSMQLFVNSHDLGKDVHSRLPQWGNHLLFNGYDENNPDSIRYNHGT